MENDARGESPHHPMVRRDDTGRLPSTSTDEFMAQYEVDDTDVYLTNNFGGPIEDQESLSVGERGPTLLEDFIFREKMMHFGMKMVSLMKSVH
jgi:catalase